MDTEQPTSFLARHEFFIRRLHSLCGLVPVGAYMVIHLVTNASILNGVSTFQNAVYQIHSLGAILPIVEWVVIFLPLIFHGVFGIFIIQGGMPNSGAYPHASNVRYTLQRATGIIAFVFIFWHVFHMHGWFHFEWWKNNVAEPYFGAQFDPYNASSSAGVALQPVWVKILYGIGLLSCVFHLANGMWTMGITCGLWISPGAQRRASVVCSVFGLLLGVVGLSALWGMSSVGEQMKNKESGASILETEENMFRSRIESGDLIDDEATQHKRSSRE